MSAGKDLAPHKRGPIGRVEDDLTHICDQLVQSLGVD
jgi:hypothetical protein